LTVRPGVIFDPTPVLGLSSLRVAQSDRKCGEENVAFSLLILLP